MPVGKIVASESGILAREPIEELEHVGLDAVLVGEALMPAPDPEAAARELDAAPRTDPRRGTASARPLGRIPTMVVACRPSLSSTRPQ